MQKTMERKNIKTIDFNCDLAQGYGVYDFMTNNYGLDDIMLLQMRADHMSLFNNQIFVEYKPPNMIKLSLPRSPKINN